VSMCVVVKISVLMGLVQIAMTMGFLSIVVAS
jgi:hypothetical protein